MKRILVQIGETHTENRLTLAKNIQKAIGAHIDFIFLKDANTIFTPNLSSIALATESQPTVDIPALPEPEDSQERFIRYMQPLITTMSNPDKRPPQLIVSEANGSQAFIDNGLFYDLIVLDKSLTSDEFLGLVQKDVNDVAEQSQKLILATPENAKDPMFDGHALIIWSDLATTARAIMQAAPMLSLAHRVTIYVPKEYDNQQSDSGSSPIMQALAYLRDYDVRAKVLREDEIASLGQNASAALSEFTFLVTGIKTQATLRDLVVKNSPKEIIKDTTLPLLLAA